MNKNLGPRILELKSQGLGYNKIMEILGCSRGAICYHCGIGQKEKQKLRCQKFREDILQVKYGNFLKIRNIGDSTESILKDIEKILKMKLREFFRNYEDGSEIHMFKINELKEKIGNNPMCYLTGRPIDLTKSRSYSLDHIIPSSKGGLNTLENCGLTCSQANKAKSDMTLDEFYKLCKEVISHNNLL